MSHWNMYVHAKARCIWLKSNFLPVIMAIEPFPSKAMMNLFLCLLKNAGKFFTETCCLLFLRVDTRYYAKKWSPPKDCIAKSA